MLGLANTISSSSTPESKYSLDFDGTDDHLDTGATFNTTFAGSFSISLWMRPDDGHPASAEYVFGSNEGDTSDDSGIRLELLTSTKVRFVLKSNEAEVYNDTSAAIFTDNAQDGWTHIVCIATKNSGADTTLSMYKNGSAVTLGSATGSVSEAEHAAFSTVRNLYIGARNQQGTAQTFYDGKIGDFAIWNTALDANNVAAIYNSGRPTNLTFNSGNYNQSSALQAYYKMGNGSFDDKANGAVHDQHAPGFGAEVVVNGDFTGDASEWDNLVNAAIDNTTGVATISVPSEGTHSYISQNVTFTNGGTYRIDLSLKGNAAAVSQGERVRIRDNASGNGGLNHSQTATLLTGEVQNLRFYWVANSNSDKIRIARHSDNDAAYEIEVYNVSIKKLNGLPGLTSGGPTFTSDTP